MVLRPIPPHRTFPFRAPENRCWHLVGRGCQDSTPGMGRRSGRGRPWIGFQIHLKLPFCSDGRISMLRGSPMWNGWKNAAIGLSALLAFVLLELMAVIGGDGP